MLPYVATASPSYPFDMMEKVKKGLRTTGPAYMHVLSVCPTGWRCPTDLSVRLGRLAVETGVFPLYEVENGAYKMSFEVNRAEAGPGLSEAPGPLPPPELRPDQANPGAGGPGISRSC